MYRYVALAFFFFRLYPTCVAQDMIGQPKFDLTSHAPEVGKMQQITEVPVNYFTGAANISIPVYTIRSKGNNVAITLNYQTGGIKAEDKHSSVGLGWLLDGGGSITRSIRGNKDEGIRFATAPRKIITPGQPTVYIWDSKRDSLANAANIYGGNYIDGGSTLPFPSSIYPAIISHNQTVAAGNLATNDDLSYFFNGLEDAEADVFYFRFAGYAGKFIFGADRKLILQPYSQDLTVIPTLTALDEKYTTAAGDTVRFRSYYFSAFKVSTPDGKDYYFGESDDARVDMPDGDGRHSISGWFVTRIVDRASLDTISISYAGSNQGSTRVKNVTKFINQEEVDSGCLNQHSGLGNETQPATVGLPLKIVSSKEELSFFYSGGLDSIKVSDRISGAFYRKIQFDYGAFLSGRVKLLGMTVKDLITNEYFPYSFGYYDTAGYGGLWSQDYWGYHNGMANYNNLFPGYPLCYATGANRLPAWPAMKLDALTEIIYPTGGKTVLEYEPHSAYTGRKPDGSVAVGDAYFVGGFNNFTLPATVGGLRIKRLLSYDPLTKDTLIQRFSYLMPGNVQSSGFLYIPPKLVAEITGFTCPLNTPGARYYMASHPVYSGTGSGPHVSYRYVQVQEEKNGLNNGRTEYEYYDDTNTDSAFYANALTDSTNEPRMGPYDVMPDFMFRRLPDNLLAGREKVRSVYNAAGELLVKETTQYKAKVYNDAKRSAVISAVLRDNICGQQKREGSGGSGGVAGSTYKMVYDPDNPAAPPTMVFTLLSANEGRRGRPLMMPPQSFYFYYPYTIHKIAVQLIRKIVEVHPSSQLSAIDTTVYSYDNASHVAPTMIASRNSKGEVQQLRTLYSLDFSDVNAGDSTFYFMRKSGMNMPVANFSYRNGLVTGGGYRKYRILQRADSTIGVKSEEYALNVQHPGLPASAINLAASVPQPMNFPASSFTSVASYRYNADRSLAGVIKKGNEKVVLIWDYSNNYVVAQATGADSADIAYTGFETGANGTWIVAGAARNAVSRFTGRRSYSLGAGNIARSGLNPSKPYIVSYWSSSTAATVNGTAGIPGMAKRGWQYFEHKVPAGATSVTVSGAVTIDELRLYPSDAQMITYAFDPMTGMTASVNPNSQATFYEYDGMGRLRYIRDIDNNIVKAASYFYTVFGKDSAIWRSSGAPTRMKPCAANPAYNTNITQRQQTDINPNSSTYGTLQWIDFSTCTTCDISAWQNTTTLPRCAKDGSNNNTGYQEQEQQDKNPCSGTSGQLRWVSTGLNTTACPVPPPPCTGADRRLINGVCVVGQRVNTASVYNNTQQKFACTFHYEWAPDCIKGSDITEYNSTPCTIGNACIPD